MVLIVAVLGGTALLSQSKRPPARLILPAKGGAVTFDHAAHIKLEMIPRPLRRETEAREP
jgi:hypothetical protein